MKMRIGFIFLLVALVLALGYTAWHLYRLTPGGLVCKILITSLFAIGFVCMFGGIAFSEKFPVKLTTVIYEFGNTWLILFLYLLIAFVIADLLHIVRLLPSRFMASSPAGFAALFGAIVLLLGAGGIHYHHKYREELELTTGKAISRPLKIVFASDLHLGYHNRRTELGRWVDIINAEAPDLVLIGGDIIDLSVRPVIEGRYAEEIRRLNAPVYTVLGNHEYFSNEPKVEQFFREAGIRLLRDSVAHFDGVSIIGRDDRTNQGRKPLSALMPSDGSFTIVLDHQPYQLEEAELAGVDFQFSGHTHRGQVWPISWITDVIFEKSWGHHKKGDTRYYVSSGLGIWGAKIRIGTRSEYLVMTLRPES